MDVQTSPPETAEAPLRYNVTGSRIVAALIDIAVLVALFAIIAIAFGHVGRTPVVVTTQSGSYRLESHQTNYQVDLGPGPTLLYAVLVLAYYVLLEGIVKATPGKVVMGLGVVDVKGGACDWPAIFIRNILRLIDGLPILYLVGFIAVAVNEKKQRIGDLAAKTLVVRAR